MATLRNILGDERLKHRGMVQAHGTGTPQNRVTESTLLNKVAKAFGVSEWPVAAIKSYVGHSWARRRGISSPRLWVFGNTEDSPHPHGGCAG